MRTIRVLLIYLVVVFIGGALLAPQFYNVVHAIAPDSHLAHNPFHRYVNRCLLILAIGGIYPLFRNLGATSFSEVGLQNPRGWWENVLRGFTVGFVSLAILAVIVIACGARHLKTDLSLLQWIGGIAGAVATAVAVGLLEEVLFRGAIFGALRKVWPWSAALLFSSAVYAIVHFMQSAELDGPIHWYSGLQLLPKMLAGFGDIHAVFPGFISLTLVGVMLGYAYQRTGNLFFSIGLHAGWIFWMKFYGLATDESPTQYPFFWGSQKLVDGWLALLVLVLALIPYRIILLRARKTSSPP